MNKTDYSLRFNGANFDTIKDWRVLRKKGDIDSMRIEQKRVIGKKNENTLSCLFITNVIPVALPSSKFLFDSCRMRYVVV